MRIHVDNKRLFRLVLWLVLTASIWTSGYARQAPAVSPDSTVYARGQVYLNDVHRLDVRALTIHGDQLRFQVEEEARFRKHALQDVYAIRVVEGTQSKRFALLGGSVAGGTATLSALSVMADYPGYDSETLAVSGVFVAGMAALGAVIGSLIGARTPRWRTLYVRGQRSPRITLRHRIQPAPAPGAVGLSARLSF